MVVAGDAVATQVLCKTRVEEDGVGEKQADKVGSMA